MLLFSGSGVDCIHTLICCSKDLQNKFSGSMLAIFFFRVANVIQSNEISWI